MWGLKVGEPRPRSTGMICIKCVSNMYQKQVKKTPIACIDPVVKKWLGYSLSVFYLSKSYFNQNKVMINKQRSFLHLLDLVLFIIFFFFAHDALLRWNLHQNYIVDRNGWSTAPGFRGQGTNKLITYDERHAKIDLFEVKKKLAHFWSSKLCKKILFEILSYVWYENDKKYDHLSRNIPSVWYTS